MAKSPDKMRNNRLKSDRDVAKHSSLLDGSDYGFEHPAPLDEYTKLYRGESSAFDDIDLEEEYCKSVETKKKKDSVPKHKSLLEDDYGEEFAVSADFIQLPRPDKVKKAKDSTPKSKSLLEDNYEGFITSKQGIADSIPSLPPPEPLPLSVMQATVRPPGNYSTTDDEDEIKDRALRIAEDFAKRENIILVGNIPCVYNGMFYTFLRDDDAQRRIFSLYRREIGQASASTVLKNAVNLLKFCVTAVYEEFPPNSDIIVFENGTLETATGHFRINSPRDLVSSALGIRYNPGRKDMPWTKYFLETIANGDDDLYELMLQVIGYILSNDVKAKSFFYLEGVGDAGKSRFCDLIASFFPASGTNKVARIALQDLGGKFALGNLVNAKLNISEDLPDSPLSPTTVSRIKMISDGNRLEAEAKYVQPFSFRPLCKLLFASNHPLRLKEHDAAFVSRVVYIPFLRPIPKDRQDKDILRKMQGELPALFNHAFEAYRRLVDNGYAWAGSERFKPNILINSSTTSIDKERVLTHFVTDCCVFDEDATTPTADLQAAYNRFCHDHTYLPIQGDRFSRELAAVLPDTVMRVKIGNLRRGFKGIRLKTPTRLSEFDDLDDDLE